MMGKPEITGNYTFFIVEKYYRHLSEKLHNAVALDGSMCSIDIFSTMEL
jgi:hypothetical protein